MLKAGKGEFYVTGVYETTKDGSPLVTKTGNKYKSIKLFVTDRDGNSGIIYDSAYGSGKEKLEEIVNSVDSQDLKNKVKTGTIKFEDLIESHGYCLIGLTPPKQGYNQRNTIELYLTYKNHGQDAMDAFKDFNPTLESSGNSSDDLPF